MCSLFSSKGLKDIHSAILTISCLLSFQLVFAQHSAYSFQDLQAVKLPQADYFNYIPGESDIPEINITVSRKKSNHQTDDSKNLNEWGISIDSSEVILLGKQSIEEIETKVNQLLEKESDINRRFSIANLYIDSSTPMYIIRHLQYQLRKLGVLRMAFIIEGNKAILQFLPPIDEVAFSSDDEYCFIIEKHWQREAYRKRVGLKSLATDDEKHHVYKAFPIEKENPCGRIKSFFDIRLDEENKIYLSDDLKEWEETKAYIYNTLKISSSKTILIISTTTNVRFEDYIKLKAEVYEIYNRLRNEALTQELGNEYKTQWEYSKLPLKIKQKANVVFMVFDY